MTSRLELVEDSAGTLYLDHTEAGRATAASVELRKPGGGTLQASTTATVDPCSTTLAAAAAAGATSLTLTSGTGVTRGRSYLITNSGGQVEEARIKSIDGAAAVLYEPLEFSYEIGDSFFGRRITYSVISTHTANRGRGYQARWSLTIGGATYRFRTLFDVVRYPWPSTILTAQDFKLLAGENADDILQVLEHRGDDFALAIEAATRAVKRGIRSAELEPDLFADVDPFKEPIAAHVILQRARDGWTPRSWQDGNQAFIDECRSAYNDALSVALDTNDSYDADDSDHVDDTEEAAPRGAVRFSL